MRGTDVDAGSGGTIEYNLWIDDYHSRYSGRAEDRGPTSDMQAPAKLAVPREW